MARETVPVLNWSEHEAAALQVWLGRCTSLVIEYLFRRGLSLGAGAGPGNSGWRLAGARHFMRNLPQTTMSPQYLQFTKGRGGCNKNSPLAARRQKRPMTPARS